MSASLKASELVTYVLIAVALVGCETGPVGSSATLEISGRIEANETHLASQIAGRVSAVEVREGDAVKAGQVLVRCSSEQALAMNDQSNAMVEAARRQVQQARTLLPLLDEKYRQLELRQDQSVLDASGRIAAGEGQLAAARADLARARSELSQVSADASTYKALADKGAVPVQAADQLATKKSTLEAIVDAAGRQVAAAEGGLSVANAAKSNPEIISLEMAALKHQMAEARAAIRSAESQITIAEAVAAQTSAAVSELTITAPYDGIVLTRSVEPGQVIAPGQTLLTLLDPRAIYLRAYVPEGQIGRVVVGQRAEVVLDSDLDSPLDAKVSRVDPAAMFTPENTYFREDRVKQVVGVKLLLTEGLGRAKVGMPADGRIFVEESPRPRETSKP